MNGNKYIRNSIQFNSKYIHTEENKKLFDEFVQKDEAILAISSPYGTGKTYTFKQLIPDFKRILFITYRQSLAQSLYDELNQEGFKNYNDLTNEGLQQSKRLIIQLDSTVRLNYQDYITLENNLPEYDLIVVDEMEGVLNHFNAKTLKRKEETYDILTRLLTETKKVICLDGDLHNRSLDFLQNTIKKEYTFYKNEYQPEKKKIKFTRNLNYFNEEMTKDLKQNKNIVLPSMLSNPTQEYKNKYTDQGYKVVCHNGIEKNNEELKHFKEEWKKADLLLYSPTIEAGVDFDTKHFDKCYGYMGENSTSARAFSQMLHRVRQFESDEVLIYIGNLFYSEKAILFFPEMLEHKLFEGYDTKQGLGNIQKHNKCEELNTKQYLLNDFIHIIERKGYEWEILKDEKKEKVDKYDYTTRMEGISEAEVLKNEDGSLKERGYTELKQKQKDGLLKEEETYQLDKYFMSKKFKIDINKIDGKFVEEHFRKEYVIDNYNKYEKGEKLEKNFNNDLLEDKIEKINKIKKWFEGEEYLSNDTLRKDFKEYFKDPSIKQLFNTYPKRRGEQKLYQNVNSHILNELGYELVSKRKQDRDKTTGKMKETSTYTIKHCKILSEYLERKAILEEQKFKPSETEEECNL